jgi:hypothetical protein
MILLSQRNGNSYALAIWSNLGTMNCPASGVHFTSMLEWPTLLKLEHPADEQEAGDGEENEGGVVRADSQGIRVRSRKHQGSRGQAWSASADGATGS